MKYYSAIISLFGLSFFAIISLLYVSNISRNIEKQNFYLNQDIGHIVEQININEIEYSLYTNYEYLKKIQKIYFNYSESKNLNNRISFNNFKNKNTDNLFNVKIEKF